MVSRGLRLLVSFTFLLLLATAAAAQTSDVGVTKTGPGTASPGTNVPYDVQVFNVGPDPAGTVTLTDIIPSGMTFVSLTQNNGPTFTCSTPAVGAGGTINCTVPAMLNGDSADFTITLQMPGDAAPSTTYVNTATVSTANDPNSENDTSVAGTSTPSNQADVAVNKTGPASAAPSSSITFTITVTNLGPADATNVTLNDTLGSGLTFVSLTQTSGPTFTCNGGSTPCTIATLPNGNTATFALVATTSATPGTYNNTATITSDNDPNPENDQALASVNVSSADLSVVKSGPATAIAGQQYSYTITVSNGGPDAATDAGFTDTLPAGLTFVSVSPTSAPGGTTCATNGTQTTITCTTPALGNGSSESFMLTVLPSSTLANGTVITNTVNTITSSNDTNGNNNSSSAQTTIAAQADVAVLKTGPASVIAGNTATYSITVTNNGPSTATSVSLVDPLPAGTTFNSESQTSGPAFTCSTPAVGGTGTISCSIASLAPAATATFNVVLNVSSGATGSISNTATVTTTTTDNTPGNNSSTATSTVATNADLAVLKTGPAAAFVGNTINYTITVTNNGPSDATAVMLTDPLPPSITFVSMTQTSGPAFNCTGTSTQTCTIATLTAGASAVFTLSGTVNAPGTISNTATVSSATPDATPGNNSSTATTNATLNADLAVLKTGPASATVGTSFSYTITVTNNGPSPASSVSLTDTLPANETFVSMTQTSGPAFSCSGTSTQTCTIATLNSGASAVFTLTVTADSGTTASNTANVTSATPDNNTANNSSTATTPFASIADLAITKTGPPSTPVPGTVNYTITVTNNGPSPAANVTLTDTIPTNTSFVSMTQTSGPAFNCSGTTTQTCTIATLNSGASAAFTLSVNLNSGPTFSNTATVSSTTTDSNPANNSATATTQVTFGTNVPTLSPLALALLGLMLAAAGMVAMKR